MTGKPLVNVILHKAGQKGTVKWTVGHAVEMAVPAFSSALSYFDSYRSARLPANLLQAQRDYFGAHTCERTDKPAGKFFHTEWFA